jgi:hypothetical protein
MAEHASSIGVIQRQVDRRHKAVKEYRNNHSCAPHLLSLPRIARVHPDASEVVAEVPPENKGNAKIIRPTALHVASSWWEQHRSHELMHAILSQFGGRPADILHRPATMLPTSCTDSTATNFYRWSRVGHPTARRSRRRQPHHAQFEPLPRRMLARQSSILLQRLWEMQPRQMRCRNDHVFLCKGKPLGK